MKKLFYLFFLFFIAINTATAQKRFFSLHDTAFESFSVLRANDISFLPGTDSILKSSAKFLNSFAAFLKKNPHLLIQITHYNFAPAIDTLLCLERAAAVCTYLEHKGIEHERLRAKGFGGRKHRENFDNYDSVKAFAEKKKFSSVTNLEILLSDYQQLFNWDDSTFVVGTHRYIHFYCPVDGPYPACLDSLIRFLSNRPKIKVKIACYDYRDADHGCHISGNINRILTNKSIDPSRFIAIDMGYKPYYTKEMEIEADKSKNRSAFMDETRQEIIILEK